MTGERLRKAGGNGHDVLLDEGWQCQTVIDEPRLSELAENYRALGYEVLVVHEGVTSGCGACFPSVGGSPVGRLYTRIPVGGMVEAAGDDDLFAP